MEIVALVPERFDEFVSLISALAKYEKLLPPSRDAIERLHIDAFRENPRYEAFLCLDDNDLAIGYAICFETYSSSSFPFIILFGWSWAETGGEGRFRYFVFNILCNRKNK